MRSSSRLKVITSREISSWLFRGSEPGAEIGGQDTIHLIDDARNGRHGLSGIEPAARSNDPDTHKETDNQDIAQVAEFLGIKNGFGNNQVFLATVAFMPQTDGV